MIQETIFDIADFLVKTFGPAGVICGGLLWLMNKQGKRITTLETDREQQFDETLKIHKEMIEEYVDLVKNKTKVLADLTSAINAIKETLDRLERKTE